MSPSCRRQCVSLAVQALLTQAQVSMFRYSTSMTVPFQPLESSQNATPVAVSPGFECRNEFKVWSNHSQQLDGTDFHTSWICSSQRAGWGLWPALPLWPVSYYRDAHSRWQKYTDMMETNTNLIAHGVWASNRNTVIQDANSLRLASSQPFF